jgi:RHS repeat-associated protein
LVKPLQNEITSYQTNNLNQLLQVTKNQGPETTNLSYDANGNMTKGYTPQGYEFIAAYDAENRLKSLEYTDTQGIVHTTVNTYRADSFLVKLEKFENHVKMIEVNFVGEGFLPIQERTTVAGQPSSVKSYIWGQNLGGGIGGLLNMRYQGQDYSYLYDGKGNVTTVLDSSQNTVATYVYDEFGKVVSKTGTLDQPFQFSTKYYDQQTGLNYYGYRFYSAALGRWINRDPLGEEGGINLYAFVENDPVNWVDPWGLSRVVYDPALGHIDIYPASGTSENPETKYAPQRFPAGNTTTNPTGDPLTPNSHGPLPPGTFPNGSGVNTGNDSNSAFGIGFIPIILPPGPNGQRTGTGIHSGRANRRGPYSPTWGCLRSTDDAIRVLQNDPPAATTVCPCP